MSFDTVKEFEQQIAKFYGAPYAVATDCCTHAIELCLRVEPVSAMTCPTNTYPSVPMTLDKLGIRWFWGEENWEDYYYLGNTRIIDAAVYWKANSYLSGTLMCLSFQFQKHLSLGRGGAILCDDKLTYDVLKRMSYDGRNPNTPWKEQDIQNIGYHYYMTPETAQLGLDRLPDAEIRKTKKWTSQDYPDLRNMTVFKKHR
jgi:dTDP-4-amino-4,6-dideoxygalactose transaminase|tara:strand:- start:893 stop:1492 length:600 start_codon:yes stop_codon:yes gene_type:complete